MFYRYQPVCEVQFSNRLILSDESSVDLKPGELVGFVPLEVPIFEDFDFINLLLERCRFAFVSTVPEQLDQSGKRILYEVFIVGRHNFNIEGV